MGSFSQMIAHCTRMNWGVHSGERLRHGRISVQLENLTGKNGRPVFTLRVCPIVFAAAGDIQNAGRHQCQKRMLVKGQFLLSSQIAAESRCEPICLFQLSGLLESASAAIKRNAIIPWMSVSGNLSFSTNLRFASRLLALSHGIMTKNFMRGGVFYG